VKLYEPSVIIQYPVLTEPNIRLSSRVSRVAWVTEVIDSALPRETPRPFFFSKQIHPVYNQSMSRTLYLIRQILLSMVVMAASLILLGRSAVVPADTLERIHSYTRAQEFDYVNWMLEALALKNAQAALNTPHYLTEPQQHAVVIQYLQLVRQIEELSAKVSTIYADPQVKDPQKTAAVEIQQLNAARALETRLGPLAEAVIQEQVSYIINQSGLSTIGQPVPPVFYRVTPLPDALIVSPRNKIDQEANISLQPGLTLDETIQIENNVTKNLDKSALVVGIGGVGVYPTMVLRTTNLNDLADTVSHEWTHNFLTLRPLGINYDASPEMRTINETTASISGKEMGRAVIARFYPELLPPPETETPQQPASPTAPQTPPPFNYNKEMHTTRVHVDELLAQGKINEAEAYMETRRQFFWDNGYLIRKMNQAFFAFYGAYNDQPGGGASGQDPVGPAVQALRKQSPSLASFLYEIAQVTSFQQLQKMVSH
jgi:hypothetical protein